MRKRCAGSGSRAASLGRWATTRDGTTSRDRHVQLARGAGALSLLPIALTERFSVQLFLGDLTAAAALMAETEALVEATGSHLAPQGAISLAAWQGRHEEATRLMDASRDAVEDRGEGLWLTSTEWTRAVLYNSLGRYEEALSAAEKAAEHPHELGVSTWVPTELIEAAARTGQVDRALGPLERLHEISTASGTDWALGVEARSRALLSEGSAAERLYLEAIERLGRTRIRVALARAHLLYGEWLRREHRRVDAREQLRTAHRCVLGDRDGGIRGACEARAHGHGREGSQAESGRRRGIHPARGPDRAARRRWPDQPRDRGATVPQSENRRVASAQGVHASSTSARGGSSPGRSKAGGADSSCLRHHPAEDRRRLEPDERPHQKRQPDAPAKQPPEDIALLA